ncbi:MAG: cardiolipin synthase [Eubacteriales bacterium]|nr:cardiolipin synthase [Eubacteriales bacterium]
MEHFGNIMGISYIINFILIIVVVFFQRKDPIVSLTWVFCFILFPIGGLLMFIVFGLGIKQRTSDIYYEKHVYGDELTEKLYEQLDFLNNVETKDIPGLDIIRYFCKYHCLYTDNNEAEIFTSAEEKYERLIDDIGNAKESINLLYFIVRKDEIGTRIMDELVKKAESGVKVRLLYDSFGCFFTPRKFLRKLNNTKCGKAVSFYPVSIFTLSKINHRNHRKIAIIDNKIAYLGGMNIGDEYMGKKKPTPWRDTHIRLTGDAVKVIYKQFCLDWDFSARDNLCETLNNIQLATDENDTKLPIQIVASGPDSAAEEIKSGLIKMLYSARHYAYIQSPYFIPDQPFRNALINAADSGVDVRLMIPGVPDKKYVFYSSLSYLEEMLNAGIKVYLYDGFIHSKTAVVDDKIATIGTTNIDIRSFQLHFEMNAFFYSNDFAVKCKQIFETDIKDSSELSQEVYKKRSLKTRIKEGFFRLFSPIM